MSKSKKSPQAAPETSPPIVTAGLYGDYELSRIRISPDNRKRFNEAALNELAESIKAIGIAQPILMRPVTPTADAPADFEIVAGERRFRASKIAGRDTIPAVVRDLSDIDAAKLRILENLQREDPHPIEEAEGYQLLMLQHGYNADQLADEIKKSRAYVYGRLKLRALTTEVREMVFNDVIPTSTALLIARIPVPALQLKALHAIIRPDTLSGEQLSVRRAAEYIQHNFMLDLTTAIFKTTDAKLVPAAGPCTTCPKRAGNDPLVFEGIRADVCTDPGCFTEKKAAHHAAIVEMAAKNGIPVAEGEERSQILLHRWVSSAEYVRPDANVFQFQRNAPATKNSGTPLSLLGTEGLPAIALYTKDDDGTTLPWYRRSDIQAALESVGACETVEQHAERTRGALKTIITPPQEPKAGAAALPDPYVKIAQDENAFRLALYKKLRAKGAASGFSLDSLRAFTKRAVWMMPLPDDLLGDVYDFDTTTETTICEYVDQAGLPEIQLLLIDLVVGEALATDPASIKNGSCIRDDFRTVLRMAAHEGIDADALREELFPTPINVDDATPTALAAFITKYPHRLAELTDVVLKHPRGDLVGMLERAAKEAGYVYARGGFEKLPPLLVGVDLAAPAADICPSLSTTIVDQGDAGTAGDEFLGEMMEAPAPVPKKQPKGKAAKDKTVLAPPAAWPFPKSSDGVRATTPAASADPIPQVTETAQEIPA
jgi:ParB/RepB/Spo0J family partition protein